MSTNIQTGDTVRFKDDGLAVAWGYLPGAQYRVEHAAPGELVDLPRQEGHADPGMALGFDERHFELVTRAAHTCQSCGQEVTPAEPSPIERSYVVDLFGMVTVRDDGTVTIDVDLADVDTDLAANNVDADQAEADSNQLRVALGRAGTTTIITRTLTPEV